MIIEVNTDLVHERMTYLGMTIEDLARVSDLNISTIRAIFRGSRPRKTTLTVIAYHLKCSVEELMA